MKEVIKIVLIFFISLSFLYSQDSTNTQIQISQEDSLSKELTLREDLPKKEKSSDIDTTIVSYARDSISFDVKTQTMRYRGNSKIEYGQQKIEAEVIELSFERSTINAYGIKDSNEAITGFPQFNDSGEKFAGEKIYYNFKTNKGVISLGETEMDEGFYYGSKIKRISENALFVKDGRYTTCEPPDFHYYFGSPEMKVLVQDKIFLDPIVLYVKDVPVFFIPFGLYFPNQTGRKSGIMVPTFFVSRNRGVVFNELGYYWAASDYWDTRITADIFTKGGYMLNSYTQWNLTNNFRGDLAVEYGRTRFNVDDNWSTNWKFLLNHDQDLTPQDRVSINLDLSSQNYNRETGFTNQEIIQQNIASRASYQKTFNNRSSLSIAYNRDQNIITNEYSQTLPIRYAIPSLRPFKGLKDSPNWVKSSQFSYSLNGQYSDRTDLRVSSIVNEEDQLEVDSTMVFSDSRRIEHRPSFSISPKFGFFTVTPRFSFSANNYFRRTTREFDEEDSVVVDTFEDGLFTEYNYSFSVNTTTKLFGIVDQRRPFLFFLKPELIGVKAFRHTFQPTIGFRYAPDLSNDDYGFYDSYYNPLIDRDIEYSRFQRDGGGLASRRLQQSLTYSDRHMFEMKVAETDSTDENYELLNLNYSFNYNYAADSLKMSDISMGFRTPAIQFLEFNGNARFTLYDEDEIVEFNEFTQQVQTSYNRVNRFLFSEGKGFARMTNLSLNISTNFSSEGISVRSKNDQTEMEQDSTNQDSIDTGGGLGQRFKVGRASDDDFDYFGDSNTGYQPIDVPWNVNLSLNYNYSQPSQNRETRNERIFLNARMNINLTDSWRLSGNAGYDFINNEFRNPMITMMKNIDCQWQLSINWTPIGFNRGFYLRFGIVAPHLRDLQFEQRKNRIFN